MTSELLFDDVEELADGLDADELIVRDPDIESLLQLSDHLEDDKRVKAEIDDDAVFLEVVELFFGDLTGGCFKFFEKF